MYTASLPVCATVEFCDMSDEGVPHIRILSERVVCGTGTETSMTMTLEFSPLDVRGRYIRWKWRAPYSWPFSRCQIRRRRCWFKIVRHSARREVLETVKGFRSGRRPTDVALAELREEMGFTAVGLSVFWA